MTSWCIIASNSRAWEKMSRSLWEGTVSFGLVKIETFVKPEPLTPASGGRSYLLPNRVSPAYQRQARRSSL
jgi:hypothetical protein